jgi:S1-C subfamily serine protease
MGIVSVSPELSRSATDKSSLRYFESDVPLLPEQLGQPVVDLYGIVVGLMVETTPYGCKALAIDSVAKRVKLMQSAMPPSAASVIDSHGDATSADQRMPASGGRVGL